MYSVVIKTYYHYGIEKMNYTFDTYEEALDWVHNEYPNAEETDVDTYEDYESDSTIEIY